MMLLEKCKFHKIRKECVENNRWHRECCTVTGVLFIVLMMMHIPLWDPFYCEDLLAPAILTLLVLEGNYRKYCKKSYLWLALFLLWACAISLIHICLDGWSNGYNFCVLVYLAGVFMFFRQVGISVRCRFIIGGMFLAAAFVFWLSGVLFPHCSILSPNGFWYITENAKGSAMAFLSRRFQFTFDNPNSLASFYVLPMLLVLSALQEYFDEKGRTDSPSCPIEWKIGGVAILLLTFLPLCHTYSKHAILSGALFLVFVYNMMPVQWKRILRHSWILVIVIGLICEVTVLWSTFPLSFSSPYINTIPGGYTIHQKTYARMLLESPAVMLTGRTMGDIKSAYPKYVEKDRAQKILRQYNAEHLINGFCTFMDPHNEYLNLLTFYGLGVLLLIVAFFLCYICENKGNFVLYFFIALAFCCLWDDLLSKRWIWIAAAIIGNHQFRRQDK